MSDIKHDATINKIEANKVFAIITSKSACLHCQMKGACNLSDCQDKTIEIQVDNPNLFAIGDKVVVTLSENFAFWAVFYGYILPLILVLFALGICNYLNISELSSGLWSLLILLPYYLVLSLLKKHFRKKIQFKIEDKNS